MSYKQYNYNDLYGERLLSLGYSREKLERGLAPSSLHEDLIFNPTTSTYLVPGHNSVPNSTGADDWYRMGNWQRK